MDLKTLRTFQMIVKYGSFHRAAEAMNYAQSTVTMQIQKLESDLGVQLINREGKMSLTEAGRLFHEQSLNIIKSMEQLQTNLSDMQLGYAGNLRLGVTEPTASYRLPDILKRFEDQFPQIRISVEFANTPTLSQQILKGEIDLALCSAPDLGTNLYFEPLFKENFVVLIPEDHLLAKKEILTSADIQGHRLLVTSATCPYRRKLEMILQEAGSISLDTMEIGSMTALKYYVQSGLGIAFVPHIVLDPIPSGTTIRAMDHSGAISMAFGILCKMSEYPLSLAGSRLYQFLKQELMEEV